MINKKVQKSGDNSINIQAENLTVNIAENENLDDVFLSPSLSINKNTGLSFNANQPRLITAKTINNRVEHSLVIKNDLEYEIERIGFRIQYPEYIEHEPVVKAPPDFKYTIEGENMNWGVIVSGEGASCSMGKITHYGSFVLEGTSILQRQQIELIIKSVPDNLNNDREEIYKDKFLYHICGEIDIKSGKSLKTFSFTAPIFYNLETRVITIGKSHITNPNSDDYVTMHRM